jgi:hypothetical protein
VKSIFKNKNKAHIHTRQKNFHDLSNPNVQYRKIVDKWVVEVAGVTWRCRWPMSAVVIIFVAFASVVVELVVVRF